MYVYVGEEAPAFPNLKVYPNPVMLGTAQSMKFDAAGEDSEVRIFTISGKLVKALSGADFPTGDITWDVLNGAGNPIRQGLYVFSITNGSGEKRTSFGVGTGGE